MKDSSTEGWILARTGSWVTGAAKREVMIARAGGLDAMMFDVATRAVKETVEQVLGSTKVRAKKPRLRLVG